LDDVGRQGHGRVRLARPEGSPGLPDARREADADVLRLRSPCGAAGVARLRMVARGPVALPAPVLSHPGRAANAARAGTQGITVGLWVPDRRGLAVRHD